MFRFRCLCLLAAMAAAPAGNAERGMTGPPSPAVPVVLVTEEAGNTALLPALAALAQARWQEGELDEAVALRRRMLRIALAASGPETPATARAMTALAQAHIDRRSWLDAEALLIVAARMPIDAIEDGGGAAIFAGLARVALSRGDTDTALLWAGRAVESLRRDPHHASVEPLRVLGAALAARERFEEGRQVLDEALAFDRQRHGFAAIETARSLSQLGNLHLRWGRPGTALPLLQEAVAIDQAGLGAAHPFIADGLHDLGLAYEALNRPEQARRFFLAALAVLERGAKRDTPRVAYTRLALGRIERQLGDPTAAEALENEASRILNEAKADERRRERRI